MATAKKYTVPPIPITLEERFTLDLNKDEARVLYGILDRIGGDADTTWRGIAGRVREALRSAGVPPTELPTESHATAIYASQPLPPVT